MQNTEPTVPSTESNVLPDKVEVELVDMAYTIDVYDTDLGRRWLDALKDNLKCQRILEKNFCFLGFADSERDLNYLCRELNKNIEQINSFNFDPPYERIDPFVADDFQYSSRLPTGSNQKGLTLKHESCNLLHRYFEDLQGTAWQLSPFYKQADVETKYSIRQLNNICHEIESWVEAYRKKIIDPEWIRPSQITTFLNAPRHDLQEQDFDLFKHNRYRRELGGVYLHWSQVGKTLYEVFRDEDAPVMSDALCSQVNHQKYYSGEFDIEWGKTIDEDTFDWKKKEMDDYREWLKANGYDWEDPKLSLGYIKIGQVNLNKAFKDNAVFKDVYNTISRNTNIKKIRIVGTEMAECLYPYVLGDNDWSQIQINSLKKGYYEKV